MTPILILNFGTKLLELTIIIILGFIFGYLNTLVKKEGKLKTAMSKIEFFFKWNFVINFLTANYLLLSFYLIL